MSMIFAIREDGLKFKELDLQMRDIRRQRPDNVSLDDVLKFHIRNTKMGSWWKTPETEFISLTNDDAPIPDISPGLYSSLILSPKAYRLLGELLKDYGEFLPVIADGETFYMFNCFSIGEADEEKCTFDYVTEDGIKMGISHLEFKESAADKLVFKTPAEFCVTLFCNARFKDIVESFELSGISFGPLLLPSPFED